MNCPSCQHENRPDAVFCAGCGERLSVICASCGRSNASGSSFCDGCGARLGESGPGAAAPERSPRDYTPRHLADRILQSKSALEGERKQVTVLFADVKGSMELAEQVDPEEWHQILDRFFQILAGGVHRFEGTVNQYTGDGMMALFGAPIAHEDHAQRACYAALHLRDELRRYADQLRRTRALNFSVRMGLNSGDVVVGKIGDDLRMDYTAQGTTVGLAARMEQLAEPGKIYVAEQTAALVSGYVGLEDLGEFDIPGLSEPVGVHALQDVGRLRTRFDIARARGLSKFVGRTDEMATLGAALERAIQGNGQVAGVVGEAGVGKSRLCFEFIEQCRARGLAVYEGHAVAYGKTVPLVPILELFRSYFGIAVRDSDEVARDKIAGRSVRLDEGLADVLPLLFDFLGVPDPRKPAPQMEPEARQRQLFEIVKRLTHARSEREPAVFLVEDLHWLDGGSEGFLENLVESLPGTRTLVLVNFRPEYRASWLQKPYYQQLPLVPLGPKATAELLQHLLGSDPTVAGLSGLIQERTAGNPFFVEEVVRSMVEAKILVGATGAYRLTTPVTRLSVPDTVQVVLAARIDRLPERDKRVLQTASVMGREFTGPVLERVVDLPPEELAESVRTLIAGGFIHEEALYPEVEYAFKHPLTQEVAYGSQLGERRQQVHARVAQALVEVHAESPDEHAALVAHHWGSAGETLEAARWHRRAAEWVMTRDMTEAHRHWQELRALASGLPDDTEVLALSVAAHVQLVNLVWRLGASVSERTRLFERGRALAERAGDLRSLAVLFSNYSLVGGARHTDEDLACYRQAAGLADQTGDTALRVGVGCVLGPFIPAGHLKEALELADKTLQLTGSDARVGADILYFSPFIWLRTLRGYLLTLMGRVHDGRGESDRAIECAMSVGDAMDRLLSHAFRSGMGYVTGDSASAVEHARRAVGLVASAGGAIQRVMTCAALGGAHILNGEWDHAIRSLDEASSISHDLELESRAYFSAGLRATAYAGRGDLDRARGVAQEAIACTQRDGAKLVELPEQLALARVLIRTEAGDARQSVEGAISRAAWLIEECGSRIWQPQINEVRAEWARLEGDEPTRRLELREAHRLCTEMGATGHAERLTRELADLEACT